MRFDIGRIDAAFRERMKAEVDRQAEAARARFITPGSGQALEYERSREEAKAYQAAGYPLPFDPSLYPFIHAQAVAYAQSPQAAADAVLSAEGAWTSAGASIKEKRLAAKRAIDAATSMEEARAATQGIAWPSP